jgi:hypothetical protein
MGEAVMVSYYNQGCQAGMEVHRDLLIEILEVLQGIRASLEAIQEDVRSTKKH